jgi:hypothetical protein
MLELSDDSGLAQKARAELAAGIYNPDHLQCDLPPQGCVLDAEHTAHAARTQLVEQHVTGAAKVGRVGGRAQAIKSLI